MGFLAWVRFVNQMAGLVQAALLVILLSGNVWAASPDVMLLGVYHPSVSIEGWVMSEKLDGVRGIWDGQVLMSRQGKAFAAPKSFTQSFPPFAIDGELFSQRGDFENISAIVRSKDGRGWDGLKLYVFDVPNASGNLFARLDVLAKYLAKHPDAPIRIIEQYPIKNKQHLKQFFQKVVRQGGEGVVLRNPNAAYRGGRSQDILKLKTTLDDECVVTAHHAGTGKYSNMLGAVSCQNQYGTFKIGSGFKDDDRLNPPKIGSVITYRYRGLTKHRKPRFATFWRVRQDKQAQDICPERGKGVCPR